MTRDSLTIVFAFAAGFVLCLVMAHVPATLPDPIRMRDRGSQLWMYEPSLN